MQWVTVILQQLRGVLRSCVKTPLSCCKITVTHCFNRLIAFIKTVTLHIAHKINTQEKKSAIYL